ncbi:hexose transporter protein [Moniliophthora roreri]|nr:hexose transporter protein [Moniliophthora roreri]
MMSLILLPFAFFLPNHANGDRNDELAKHEVKEFTETINREALWKILFASLGNRRRAAILTLTGRQSIRFQSTSAMLILFSILTGLISPPPLMIRIRGFDDIQPRSTQA